MRRALAAAARGLEGLPAIRLERFGPIAEFKARIQGHLFVIRLFVIGRYPNANCVAWEWQ
jgi:hypothetical protein